MIPYFRIRVEINPSDDGAENEFRDCNELRLALARQCGREDDAKSKANAESEDEIAIAEKLTAALLWISNHAPCGDADAFLAFLIGQLISGKPEVAQKVLEAETECGDADWGDLIRKTAKECEQKGI